MQSVECRHEDLAITVALCVDLLVVLRFEDSNRGLSSFADLVDDEVPLFSSGCLMQFIPRSLL